MTHLDENDMVDLAGALGRDAGALVQHLAACAACRKRVEALAMLRDVLSEEVPFPASESDTITAEVLRAERTRRWSQAADVRISRALVPALATLCAVVTLWLGSAGGETSPLAVIGLSVAVGGAMAFRAGSAAHKLDAGPALAP